MKKNLHLVCNAHLDPVWLWEWEEGAAAAISTFRTAAALCEEYGAFVFNHNEVILYRWVEEYEPELFRRIQRLVGEGKWHIMGGWYLQPDCNMPNGESFVRQILAGRSYFQEKFGATPTTAINFDPFGHTRGLVQILKKSGYDSYLFCRPNQQDCPLPNDDFTWVGFDGSEIAGHRSSSFYNHSLGKAREKVEKWIAGNPEKPVGLVLWGVGNHGGGPSRQDLDQLAALIAECQTHSISHSSPEAYFRELRESGATLPRHENDLNPWAPGCYTSQIRIKQKHRLLENALYQAEKMAAAAELAGLTVYPREEFREAMFDLLHAEFHDILPGSSIQPVEEAALRLMDHGLEILSRVRARTFFALSSGQPKAEEGHIPILVYNPHPFPVRTLVECELQLADVNWAEDSFTVPIVHHAGNRIPCQTEQELSSLNLDWRKRSVFLAELAPSQMNRFDCTLQTLHGRPKSALKPRRGRFEFRTKDLQVDINCATGLIDRYSAGGRMFLKKEAFKLLVIEDNEDPWEIRYKSFRNVAGEFSLMPAVESTEFAGVATGMLKPVRIIEDGDVRTVVEAIFEYHHSFAVVHYKIPKAGAEIELAVRVYWNEKSKMLKLAVPTVFKNAECTGQVAYGAGRMPVEREAVAQKWAAVMSEHDDAAFTCINTGTYGLDFAGGELRISMLRGPAYSGHPIEERVVVPQDRCTPRIDQGERMFRFWFCGGHRRERLDAVDREALVKNEHPFALSFFPSGAGTAPKPLVTLSDDVTQITAFKKAEASEDYILRLFEPTGQPRAATVSFPGLSFEKRIKLGPFELKTFRLDVKNKTLAETDLLEQDL